ncbi:hypothetical protein LME05_11900 [Leuconostoc mesenteroides subsp. cremoris]|nr:hypothetical protein LME05_11900 [Leuconostoc mesenteroides subsp. cremoris]
MKILKNYQALRYIVIIMALEIVAISINFFYAPAKVAAGGATGLAILINELVGFDRQFDYDCFGSCFFGSWYHRANCFWQYCFAGVIESYTKFSSFTRSNLCGACWW